MTPEARRELAADLMQAEGFRHKPYLDCCGKYWRECECVRKGRLSVGYGRNLDDVGISRSEAEVLLHHDVYSAEANAVRAFQWFPSLNDIRQRAITEVIFNVGMTKFLGFRQTIAAVKAGFYRIAAEHLLDSKWKTQVGPTRSERIARYLRDGG